MQDRASRHYRLTWIAGMVTNILPFGAAALAALVVMRIDALQSSAVVSASSPVLPVQIAALLIPKILAGSFWRTLCHLGVGRFRFSYPLAREVA